MTSEAERRLQAQSFEGEHFVARPLAQPSPPLVNPGGFTSANELVAALDTQNKVARRSSREQLDAWFPGYDFHAAAQTTDDRRFTVLAIGTELFDHLNAIEVVEHVISTHDFVGNQIRFSGGLPGADDPERIYAASRPGVKRLHIGPLVDALDAQRTAIVNNIDHFDPASSAVSEHIERVTGAQTNVNVYCSFGHAEGFGDHWDNHDTLIVPAAGKKKWTVYEPTELSPMRPWVTEATSPRPVWEGVIEPGMCLIIPRGWGHSVGGSDDLAIHYTIGVNRISVNNVLQRLVVESGYNPIMRADVAYDPSDDINSYDRSIHDDPEALRDIVSELATPELVDRAISTYRARVPFRMFPRLFDMWTSAGIGDWSGASVRMPVPMGVQVLELPDALHLGVDNQLISPKPEALKIITALSDTLPHTLDELPHAEDSELQTSILRELARAGLVDVHL